MLRGLKGKLFSFRRICLMTHPCGKIECGGIARCDDGRLSLFERCAFRPSLPWRLKRQQDPARAEALSQEVQGLDTLWRVRDVCRAGDR